MSLGYNVEEGELTKGGYVMIDSSFFIRCPTVCGSSRAALDDDAGGDPSNADPADEADGLDIAKCDWKQCSLDFEDSPETSIVVPALRTMLSNCLALITTLAVGASYSSAVEQASCTKQCSGLTDFDTVLGRMILPTADTAQSKATS